MHGLWTDRPERKNRIDKWKRKTKNSSKPNGSEYFERIGNHVNVSSCQNLTVMRTYAWKAASFIHKVLSMVNPPFSNTAKTCKFRFTGINLRRFSRMKYSAQWKQHVGKMQDCLPRVALRYADLSSLIICDIQGDILKVFQKWFNSAVVFMVQIFFHLCANNLSSQSVDFGRLFRKVSVSVLTNYLLTSLARSVWREYQTSVLPVWTKRRSDIFSSTDLILG